MLFRRLKLFSHVNEAMNVSIPRSVASWRALSCSIWPEMTLFIDSSLYHSISVPSIFSPSLDRWLNRLSTLSDGFPLHFSNMLSSLSFCFKMYQTWVPLTLNCFWSSIWVLFSASLIRRTLSAIDNTVLVFLSVGRNWNPWGTRVCRSRFRTSVVSYTGFIGKYVWHLIRLNSLHGSFILAMWKDWAV